jgi:hypothetical protein
VALSIDPFVFSVDLSQPSSTPDGTTVMPSARAVIRLITSSKFCRLGASQDAISGPDDRNVTMHHFVLTNPEC